MCLCKHSVCTHGRPTALQNEEVRVCLAYAWASLSPTISCPGAVLYHLLPKGASVKRVAFLVGIAFLFLASWRGTSSTLMRLNKLAHRSHAHTHTHTHILRMLRRILYTEKEEERGKAKRIGNRRQKRQPRQNRKSVKSHPHFVQ